MAGTLLGTTAPFDGAGVFRYLAGHAIPGVESGDEHGYRRRMRWGGAVAELEVRLAPAPDAGPESAADAVLATLDGGPLPPDLVTRIRRLLDLDADSAAIDGMLAEDPVFALPVAAAPGIRLPGSLDPHEELFRTLVGQQISIAATRSVLGRISRELCGDSGLFPTAEQFAERGLEVLRGPASRVATIHGVALALASGELVIEESLSVAELTERLVAMPGIGPWTAGYVAMRALGASDTLLSTDLVLLKGAAALGLPGTPRGIAERAARWSPYRSYATLHLWRIAQAK
ncbi:DNA-3-methyladenine glycosylase [Leifsonia bigeumensis]|uniref:DNA-3-methyladenine glycosylase II n=1 Tax=Leifsonella bigeumensis TaxID=433643 RepID=A0ABP7FSJ1_9MICO